MTVEIWLTFIVASAILLAIPGPTILTVISYSLTHGCRSAVSLVAAVALGDATALVASLIGLGTLLSASAFGFMVVKMIGGIYLLYLGLKMLLSGVSSSGIAISDAPGSRWKLFLNTYIVTATNPKGIIFFIAFLPQFVASDESRVLQLLLLGATFVVLAVVNAAIYAAFASSARRFLTSVRAQLGFNWVGGSLLSAAGTWVLLAKRHAY